MICCLRDGNGLNMDFKWLILDAFLHSIIDSLLNCNSQSFFIRSLINSTHFIHSIRSFPLSNTPINNIT